MSGDPTNDERQATYAHLHRLACAHAVLAALERVLPVVIQRAMHQLPAIALRRAVASVVRHDGTIRPSPEDYDAARRDAAKL